MSYDETGRYCSVCGGSVLARRKGTNHILHLILTILTGGFWVFIWIGCCIKIGAWRCSNCGSRV